MQRAFADHIRPKLEALDKARTYLPHEEADLLPAIVVVGDQSSGRPCVEQAVVQNAKHEQACWARGAG